MVLDGRGHIAGDHLAGIVIDGECDDMLRVAVAPVAIFADERHAMSEHGNLQGMFRVVLGHGRAHQPPAADIAQAGDVGEKVVNHRENSSCWGDFVLMEAKLLLVADSSSALNGSLAKHADAA